MLPHQVIGNGNGWAKENVFLLLLRCASFAAVLPSLGDCCFGDDGFLVGTVVQLCSCVGDLLDFRGLSTPNSSPIPKKELLPGPQLGWFSNPGLCQHLCLHRCTQQTPCCEAGFTVVDHQTCCRVDSAAIGFAPWSLNRKEMRSKSGV